MSCNMYFVIGLSFSGLFNLIAISVFGAYIDNADALDWSFALACCSCIIMLVDGAVFLVFTVKGSD